MIDLFSEAMRRDPHPMYEQMRSASSVFHVPPLFDMSMIFDYDGAKRALNDHETFSSAVPAPDNWFIFFDPPLEPRKSSGRRRGYGSRPLPISTEQTVED